MIVVFISARTPLFVAEVTHDQLMLWAHDDSSPVSHTSSLPPGSYDSDVERAWTILSKDKIHAARFHTAEAAEEFYTHTQHGLSTPQAVAVLNRLRQIRGSTQSGQPPNPGL